MYNKFIHIEAFSESFPNLDTELIQLSKGAFNSESITLANDDFIVDRRKSEAAHTHSSIVQNGTMNFVFPNNIWSNNIILNNLTLSQKQQVIAFSNEEMFSTLPCDFNITTLTIYLDTLQEYVDFNLDNFCPSNFRSLEVNLSRKFHFLSTIESTFQELHFNSALMSDIVKKDMKNTIYIEAANYLTSELFKTEPQSKLNIEIQNRQKKNIYDAAASIPLSKLNVEELARQSMLSKRTLTTRCRQFYNLTPNQFIVAIRLNRAYKFLSNKSDEKRFVTKVMNQCGVTNVSRFNNSYLEFFGELPLETLKRSNHRKR